MVDVGGVLMGSLRTPCWLTWLGGWPLQGGGLCFLVLSWSQNPDFRGLRSRCTCTVGVCLAPYPTPLREAQLPPGLQASETTSQRRAIPAGEALVPVITRSCSVVHRGFRKGSYLVLLLIYILLG